MTGYTVHTGSSEKFSEGWDRIFSGVKQPAKKAKTISKPATKNKQTKKPSAARKQSKGKK